MLGQIGSRARAQIEALLGTQVMLRLWVKVRPDWRNSNNDLKTLGYGE
jgi:GTP-binding protein Era